jgi:hypothetical protein
MEQAGNVVGINVTGLNPISSGNLSSFFISPRWMFPHRRTQLKVIVCKVAFIRQLTQSTPQLDYGLVHQLPSGGICHGLTPIIHTQQLPRQYPIDQR